LTESAPFFADLADGPPGGQAQWLLADDGVRFRAGIWPAGSKGTVFILPGRAECLEKYGRTASDLARRGFASLSIDWRGQGLADRLSSSPMLGHVGRFSDYQKDLRATLGKAGSLGLPEPYFLLAHSMGGAIALRALIDGFPAKAAAFTAPMWGIRITPLLRPFALSIAGGAHALGLDLSYAPGTAPVNYVAVAPFVANVLTSDPEMFVWMKRQVLDQPQLSLGGPSMHWLHEALLECRALAALPSPAIPAYVAVGSQERTVDPAPIRSRMKSWNGGILETYARARHEILMETPETRKRFFDRMSELFDQSG
jgi:lysophospholipase